MKFRRIHFLGRKRKALALMGWLFPSSVRAQLPFLFVRELIFVVDETKGLVLPRFSFDLDVYLPRS